MAETLDETLEPQEPGDDWDGDAIENLEDLEEIEDLEDIDATEGEDADAGAEDEGSSDSEALDELEAEELEMLTEDEEAESLPVDEAEELRQIRRAAMSLESAADSAGADEFVCANCFLVKAGSQLADKRKKLCRDCA